MKPFIIFFITVVFIAACIITAVFLSYSNQNNDSQTPLRHEPSVTLNEIICDAMTVYATVPYRRYSSDELQKYFIYEIADEIQKSYEPFSDPSEETPIEFEEQTHPEIGSIKVQFEDGEYTVKLQFGEVFYNYSLTIAPNRLITKITDRGITFE